MGKVKAKNFIHVLRKKKILGYVYSLLNIDTENISEPLDKCFCDVFETNTVLYKFNMLCCSDRQVRQVRDTLAKMKH